MAAAEAGSAPPQAAHRSPQPSSPATNAASGFGPDWRFSGTVLQGTCAAMGDGPVTVAAFVRRLSSELYARGINDEIVRGITLRTLLHGAASAAFLQHIDQNDALAARVRSGTVTFDDYAHALYACIPAGKEADLLHQIGRAHV